MANAIASFVNDKSTCHLNGRPAFSKSFSKQNDRLALLADEFTQELIAFSHLCVPFYLPFNMHCIVQCSITCDVLDTIFLTTHSLKFKRFDS